LLVLVLVFLATLVSHATSFFSVIAANQRYHTCSQEQSLQPKQRTSVAKGAG
jgi:hypothetical protein